MATITFKGNPIHTIGELPAMGSQAPDFTLTKIDLSEIHLKDFLGKKLVLSIFPSIDTATCATAERQFDTKLNQLENVILLCISADLPFAQKRFCAAEHLTKVIPASVFRSSEFGTQYGVTILEGPLTGLLSRAVIVLDEQGKIIYREQVKEIAHEPNYDAILAILK